METKHVLDYLEAIQSFDLISAERKYREMLYLSEATNLLNVIAGNREVLACNQLRRQKYLLN